MPTHKDLAPWPIEDEWWNRDGRSEPPRPPRPPAAPVDPEDQPLNLHRRVTRSDIVLSVIVVVGMIAYKTSQLL